MEKTYKFRAYPNKTQEKQIKRTFEATRFVYNYYLSKQIALYQRDKSHLTFNQMCKDLTSLKKDEKWLGEVSNSALQNSIKNLNNAYNRYFLEMKKNSYVRYSEKKLRYFVNVGHTVTLYDSAWHPKYKDDSNRKYSFKLQNDHFDRKAQLIMFDNMKIKLPKLGWVKVRDKRTPQGKILNASIVQEPSGKYYIFLCCTGFDRTPIGKTDKQIGVDLGVNYYCSFSDGNKEPNPKFYKNSLDKLAKLQGDIDKKKPGSNNREKARLKYIRFYEKISNQKMDYINKLTTKLIRENDVICIEDLDIQEMIEEVSGPRKRIEDIRGEYYGCSWSKFRKQILYKADWYDREAILVNRWYPSSQICHICGHRNTDIRGKNIKEWDCPNCRTHHNRDYNAAVNILNEGLKQRISK